MHTHSHTTRRAVLGAGIAAAGSALLSACSRATEHGAHGAGPAVLGVEAKPVDGPVRAVKFTATPGSVELGGGRTVKSWLYGDRLPGQEVRITAGDTLALTLANHLPESTSLHWHGIALRNDMDGVPNVTQPPIRPGESFAYRFVVPHAGTYWFHPHSGVQIDRGMYSPLIVDDPKEPLSYDREWIVILDDWVDGVDGSTPDGVFAQLRKGRGGGMDHGMGHGGQGKAEPSGGDSAASESGPSRLLMGMKSDLLGGDAGAVDYPYYLINGRTPDDPSQFTAKPGDRIRLRIINAGGDTAFRVALGGHTLTVAHTDGFPVRHARTDALLVGMGERYDVLFTAKDGVFPLTALAEGKKASAMAVLRTGSGALPRPSACPAELYRRVLASASRLVPDESVALSRRRPDRTIQIKLTGGMEKFDWAFDRKPYSPQRRLVVRSGERVRLVFINVTEMWHPIHLHGHTFALAGVNGAGARKDTASVLPHRKLTLDFDADNPGLWMLHCHNIYHSESGMMTTVAYRE
ncbi:multicopper oxidase family protein [Streptomyces sp. A3M-1-3]|uniref:multicopper oxidase family protein n=1 Tax=Streptomyces sp. A3M-1-3 TaxID=2962044 RepID=UPI0020B8166D|nr:multicopper oxidase family protein [Streptomyces sp. A3M-1-3]MCP3819553.1 multicopper oxidase family protein [Streptomyces sp. A3M-1-3]